MFREAVRPGRAPAGRPYPPRSRWRARDHRADGRGGHGRGRAVPAAGEAGLDELSEARVVLEEIACDLASERTEPRDRAELHHLADDRSADPAESPRDLHALIASASRNAGLELFVDVLSQVAELYSPRRQRIGTTAEEPRHAHAGIAEAVIAGDGELARTRMRTHLQAEADVLVRRRSTRRLLPESLVLTQSSAGKGAETVARNITRIIVADGLQPGDLVGTEPELIQREDVGRALLREAVRLLEHHQIAQMRRGPGGGLFVMAPDTAAVASVAGHPPDPPRMKLAELADLRQGVEVALTDLAAARSTTREPRGCTRRSHGKKLPLKSSGERRPTTFMPPLLQRRTTGSSSLSIWC